MIFDNTSDNGFNVTIKETILSTNLSIFDSVSEDIEFKGNESIAYYTSPDIPNSVWIISSITLAILGAFGIISNVTIVFVYLRKTALQDEFTLMLMNLIFAELIMAVYGIPINFTASIMHGWKFGHLMCDIFGFSLTLGGMVSIYTLTALAIHRLWTMYTTTVARPGVIHDIIKQMSLHLNSIHIILITWILGLSIALPPLLGWSYYTVEPNGLSCAPAWSDPESSKFVVYIFTIGFIIPNTIIILSSIFVIQIHSKHIKRSIGRIAEINGRRQKRITRMVILMVLAFNISWAPYAFVCVLKLLRLNFVTPLWSFPGLCFSKSSCCWNPVIYVFFNPKFRREILPEKLDEFLGNFKNQHRSTRFPQITQNQKIGENVSTLPVHTPAETSNLVKSCETSNLVTSS